MSDDREPIMPERNASTPAEKIRADQRGLQLVEYRRKLRSPMRGGKR